MNNYKKRQYKVYLPKYLEKEFGIVIKNKRNKFQCPVCHKDETATIYPNNITKMFCLSPDCSFKGDIFDLVKKTKNSKLNDEKIADFLNHTLDITIQDELKEIFDLYEKNNFCLFPVAKNSKIPTIKEWQKSENRNRQEWIEWVENNQNIGLNLGKVSGVVLVEFDDKKTEEKFKDILGETLIQTAKRGNHYLFKYDPDFYKTLNKVLRDDGYDMELRTDGAYALVAPSSASGEIRKWNNKPIAEMPKELKEFFMKYYKEPEKDEKKDDIEKDIQNNNLDSVKLQGLDGYCNDFFVKYGGVLRKKCNKEQVEYALYNLNKALADPMDNKDIRLMCKQIEKYDRGDQKELAKQIFRHLKVVDEGSSFEIATSLRYEKKDVEDALKYLQEQGKVFKRGKNYKVINKAEWRNTFVEECKILPFNVPYFNDCAVFRNGDMIIIGAKPGSGKSTVAMNFIRNFVSQKIKPYYINLESGNRFVSNAMKLGLKEGDFYWTNNYSPQSLELEDNAVTIVDWLLPDNYAETDKLYARFSEQLDKHGGLLIIFVQLKKWKDKNGKEKYDFFAPNLIDMFPSFVCKYEYSDGHDNQNTYFETTKIRESKNNLQYLTIPTYFDKESKILKLRK